MLGRGFLLSIVISLNSLYVVSNVYVVHNLNFGMIVASYPDAVSRYGPDSFRTDGFLVISDPLRACKPITCAPGTNCTTMSPRVSRTSKHESYIVLIEYGECDFGTKVFHALSAGFSGVIVFNNKKGQMSYEEEKDDNYRSSIPTVMVARYAGLELMNYSISRTGDDYIVNMVSFHSLPLKYILLSLLIVVGISLLALIMSFMIRLCSLWRRINRGRLPRRLLRQLTIKRFVKGLGYYDTCPICLEDYTDKEKLRLLPCNHAFHMKCIDPWLLRNRRHCPVCNQVVTIIGAPPMLDEDERDTYSTGFISRYLNGLIFLSNRRNSRSRSDTSPPVSVVTTEERTPLLHVGNESPICVAADPFSVMHIQSKSSNLIDDELLQTDLANPKQSGSHDATSSSHVKITRFNDDDDDAVSRHTLLASALSRSSPPAPAIASILPANDDWSNMPMTPTDRSYSHLLELTADAAVSSDCDTITTVVTSTISPGNNDSSINNNNVTVIVDETVSTTNENGNQSDDDLLLLTDLNSANQKKKKKQKEALNI